MPSPAAPSRRPAAISRRPHRAASEKPSRPGPSPRAARRVRSDATGSSIARRGLLRPVRSQRSASATVTPPDRSRTTAAAEGPAPRRSAPRLRTIRSASRTTSRLPRAPASRAAIPAPPAHPAASGSPAKRSASRSMRARIRIARGPRSSSARDWTDSERSGVPARDQAARTVNRGHPRPAATRSAASPGTP